MRNHSGHWPTAWTTKHACDWSTKVDNARPWHQGRRCGDFTATKTKAKSFENGQSIQTFTDYLGLSWTFTCRGIRKTEIAQIKNASHDMAIVGNHAMPTLMPKFLFFSIVCAHGCGMCPAPGVLRQCTVVFPWKCCVYHIYHVEFLFQFGRLVLFRV